MLSRIRKHVWFTAGLGLVVGLSTNALAEDKMMAKDGSADDHFGEVVSLSGDVALIGSHYDDDRGTNSGAAYVFQWTGSEWTSGTKLLGSDTAANDSFGWDVCVSGDVALVGCPYNDAVASDCGAAYVFRKVAGQWKQEAKLTSAGCKYFGFSVALSGDLAVIGSGRSYAEAFRFDGKSWIDEGKLLPSDKVDSFGVDVAMSGEALVVGAPHDDPKGTSSGSAYVFRRQSGKWVQEAKFFPSTGTSYQLFGDVLSIDGDRIAVGVWRDPGHGSYTGAAYVFERVGGKWAEMQRLESSDAVAGQMFGQSIAVRGSKVLVGAVTADSSSSKSGAAYLFDGSGTQWVETSKFTSSDAETDDRFGMAVAMLDDRMLIGANGADAMGPSSGAAYADWFDDAYASWSNYGEGWSGRYGEPSLLCDHAPVLGTWISLDLSNEAGQDTVAAFLFGGYCPGIPTGLGGSLWVLPMSVEWIALPKEGGVKRYQVPEFESLAGVSVFVQTLQVDAGASKGVAFSKGLELTLGF